MKFEEYDYVDKNGGSNCILRSFSKMFNIPYERVEKGILQDAKELGYDDYKKVEVFEKYLETCHTYPINYGKNIQIKNLELSKGKYVVFCYDKKDNYHMVYIKDGILYDKNDKSLELYTIQIYKLNELELYKIWFNNYSFFNNNSFIIDELENLWELNNIIKKNYINCMDIEVGEYSKLSKEEIINIVQDYYNVHNIDININELIKNEELILEDFSQGKENNFFKSVIDGNSGYNKEKNKIVANIFLKNTAYDTFIIIHELTHNRNQPDGDRNITSDLLTESLSYTNEIISCDEFKNDKDKMNHFIIFCKTLFNFSYYLHNIYKILRVYTNENDITAEAYNKCYNDNEYEKTMDYFNEFVETKQSIYKSSYYLLGLSLAIYMFNEYKKDSNFFNKIEELNNSINKLSFNECLNIIGIKNLEDFTQKFEESSNSFTNYLLNRYDDKIKIKQYIK